MLIGRSWPQLQESLGAAKAGRNLDRPIPPPLHNPSVASPTSSALNASPNLSHPESECHQRDNSLSRKVYVGRMHMCLLVWPGIPVRDGTEVIIRPVAPVASVSSENSEQVANSRIPRSRARCNLAKLARLTPRALPSLTSKCFHPVEKQHSRSYSPPVEMKREIEGPKGNQAGNGREPHAVRA